MKLHFVFPYPPSVNTYWRNVAGRTILSKKGRLFKTAIGRSVTAVGGNKQLSGRLSVDVILHPRDKRRRDIDNSIKALLDGMQSAGVYIDDEQIDHITITRGEIEKGGVAVVTVSTLPG